MMGGIKVALGRAMGHEHGPVIGESREAGQIALDAVLIPVFDTTALHAAAAVDFALAG